MSFVSRVGRESLLRPRMRVPADRPGGGGAQPRSLRHGARRTSDLARGGACGRRPLVEKSACGFDRSIRGVSVVPRPRFGCCTGWMKDSKGIVAHISCSSTDMAGTANTTARALRSHGPGRTMGKWRGARVRERASFHDEKCAGSDAGTGDRTRMSFRTQDFKSRASASFAIPARGPLKSNGGAFAPPSVRPLIHLT